jgi:dihydroorotate dehydrogenase (NAD+) catalytic subunit
MSLRDRDPDQDRGRDLDRAGLRAHPRDPAREAPAPDLSTELAGLELPNPVVLASGTAMYGREISRFVDLSAVGAVVTKSVLEHPWRGSPPPRGASTPSGMLNCIGLQGDGVETLLAEHLPWLRDRGARTIVSLAATTVEAFGRVAARIAEHASDIGMVEVNISCPNVEDQSAVFARDPRSAAAVVERVRTALPELPLAAKLSADVADIVAVARACVEAGADALSLINTLLGASIDRRTFRPRLSGIFGGLSGPAIRPVAVRCVWQVHEALPEIPILGGGGVAGGWDALELTLAGASAVAIGTVNFDEPDAAYRITEELASLLARSGIDRYRDAVGLSHHLTHHEGGR